MKTARCKSKEWNTIPVSARRKLVDIEEKDVDIVAQKYLLMLVHAPTLFEADEIIASMSI